MKIKERDRSLDILRGIAIIFVIFGHVTRDVDIQAYIWGFHMPIFFFISGVLYNPSKYDNTIDFVKSKFKSLMIPYIFFYLLTMVYWILIEKHVRGGELTISSQLIGLIYGTYSLDYMYFNGALWFIPCLFSMEMIYMFVSKFRRWWLILIITLVMNIIGIKFVDVLWKAPFGINAALIAICFYAVGNTSKCIFIDMSRKQWKWIICIILICIMLQYYTQPYTGKADLAALDIYSPCLYIPVGIVGITLYFSIAKIIERNTILEWLGRSSLVLFAFQEPVYRAIIFVGSKIVHIEPDIFRQNILCCICTTFITIIVICPLVVGYDKWINPIIKKM